MGATIAQKRSRGSAVGGCVGGAPVAPARSGGTLAAVARSTVARARVGEAAGGDAQAQVLDAEVEHRAVVRGHAHLTGRAAAQAGRGAGPRAGGGAVVE